MDSKVMHPEEGRTAWIAGLHRAAHQLLEAGRVYADPLAVPIIGPDGAAIAYQMSHYPGSVRWRLFLAARGHFAEHRLSEGVERRGITQLVLLGAGLDTFAYRNPFEGRLMVFEVDHPATQAWKRALLREAGIAVPESVRYAEVDFEKNGFLEQLKSVGFENEPTFFSCLGLFYYLKRDAIKSILESIAGLSGEVVFDYSDPPETLSAFERQGLARAQERSSDGEDPFVSHFDPADLRDILHALGFSLVDDLGTEAWMTRYGGAELLASWRDITGNPNRGAHILFARP